MISVPADVISAIADDDQGLLVTVRYTKSVEAFVYGVIKGSLPLSSHRGERTLKFTDTACERLSSEDLRPDTIAEIHDKHLIFGVARGGKAQYGCTDR